MTGRDERNDFQAPDEFGDPNDSAGLDPTGMQDHEANLPDGVIEEYRDITDEDLDAVGADRTTLGVQGGGIDDLPDDLDDDGSPLEDDRA